MTYILALGVSPSTICTVMAGSVGAAAVFCGNAKLVGSVAGSVGAWPGDPFCSIRFGNLMEMIIALLT